MDTQKGCDCGRQQYGRECNPNFDVNMIVQTVIIFSADMDTKMLSLDNSMAGNIRTVLTLLSEYKRALYSRPISVPQKMSLDDNSMAVNIMHAQYYYQSANGHYIPSQYGPQKGLTLDDSSQQGTLIISISISAPYRDTAVPVVV